MNENSETLEHEAIFKMNQLLRRSEASAREEIEKKQIELANQQIELDKYKKSSADNGKHVLTSILKELCTHYETNIEKVNENSILGSYYVIDQHNQYHLLPDTCECMIENLWYGRVNQFKIDFMDNSCVVKLHPSLLKDSLPMVIIDVNGTEMCIVKRQIHLTHMHMYKFQPILNGMGMKSDVATECLRYISQDSISLWPNNDELESIAAVWLRRPKTVPSRSTLQVNPAAIEKFLKLVSSQDTQCHFLLSGQISLFAYIQVTYNSNEIFMLPVGSVNC